MRPPRFCSEGSTTSTKQCILLALPDCFHRVVKRQYNILPRLDHQPRTDNYVSSLGAPAASLFTNNSHESHVEIACDPDPQTFPPVVVSFFSLLLVQSFCYCCSINSTHQHLCVQEKDGLGAHAADGVRQASGSYPGKFLVHIGSKV